MTVNDVKKGNLQTVYADPNVNNKASAGPKLGIGQTQQVGEIAKGNYSTSQPTVSNAPATSNAMTGGSSSSNAMANTQPVPNGMLGVRDKFEQSGVTDIGWNDATKSVTAHGVDVLSPSTIINGKSYATEQDINKAISKAYKAMGKELVGADNYVANSGIANAVTWSDGKMMIGGTQVPVAFVDADGTAYADKVMVDNAIATYKTNAGIKGNQAIVDDWESKYGDRIQDALDAIMNREKWSYNPEDDPAYQAYADAYMREGNRAYQNAYAQMAANMGGYGSSAASTAADQQMNYYMQQLGDRVPELMKDSYNRYLGEQELNRSALESLRTVANDDYDRVYQANRDSVNDSNLANYRAYQRRIDARKYNRDEFESDRDYNTDTYRYEREWPYKEASYKQSLESGDIANKISNMEYVLSKFLNSGNYDIPISPEDAAIMGIQPNPDGTYPTVREIQEQYARLLASTNWITNNTYY